MSSVGPQYTYLHSIAIHILPGAAEYSNPHFSPRAYPNNIDTLAILV